MTGTLTMAEIFAVPNFSIHRRSGIFISSNTVKSAKDETASEPVSVMSYEDMARRFAGMVDDRIFTYKIEGMLRNDTDKNSPFFAYELHKKRFHKMLSRIKTRSVSKIAAVYLVCFFRDSYKTAMHNLSVCGELFSDYQIETENKTAAEFYETAKSLYCTRKLPISFDYILSSYDGICFCVLINAFLIMCFKESAINYLNTDSFSNKIF